MADRTEPDQPTGATLHAAISQAVVGLLREYTGRGPMKSRTTAHIDEFQLVEVQQDRLAAVAKPSQAFAHRLCAGQVELSTQAHSHSPGLGHLDDLQ